jgi:hypothetical protein
MYTHIQVVLHRPLRLPLVELLLKQKGQKVREYVIYSTVL